MSTKISVARALRDLERTEEKIISSVNNGEFAFLVVGGKVDGKITMTEQQMKNNITASYNSLEDLIKHRSKLKAAIVASNAKTMVSTSLTGDITVAEAIEMKRYSDTFATIAQVIRNKSANINDRADITNRNVENEINKIVASTYGGGATDVDVGVISTPLIERSGAKTVGVEEALKYAEEIKEKYQDFKSEIDYLINESNAITLVEI